MSIFFFFNDTATTEIYTLSLHDALPICHDHLHELVVVRNRPAVVLDDHVARLDAGFGRRTARGHLRDDGAFAFLEPERSEEHTSELQSQSNLVCRLLLENKKRQ